MSVITSENFSVHFEPIGGDSLYGSRPCSQDSGHASRDRRGIASAKADPSAAIAALHARIVSCEQQLMTATKQVEFAAASSRVPMLMAEAPKMTRLLAGAVGSAATEKPAQAAEKPAAAAPIPAWITQGTTASFGAEQTGGEIGTVIGREEVAAFFKRLSDLEEAQFDQYDVAREAIDATRAGMEHLARELQAERLARREMQAEIDALAALGPSFDRFKKSLTSELITMVKESIENVNVDIHSRVQLLILELRSQLHCGRSEALVASSVKAASSLRDWLPQDRDGNVAATTSMLMHMGVFDNMDLIVPGGGLPHQLVARPNTRFVHRTVIAIKHTTGYPQGILENWPEPYDAKLDFINKVWASVADTLGLHELEFDAEGVLRCTNRKGTRRLLQLLAIAAARERGSKR